MKEITDRLKFLFATTRGLVLVSAAVISIIVAVFGMLSGPLKEWGLAEVTVRVLHMDLQPREREGRIIILYHTIAFAFVALLTYLITDLVKMKENQVRNIRTSMTVGYLLAVVFGLGFAYWGHNWAFHGLFLTGAALIFYSGCLLAVALWPWGRDRREGNSNYARTPSGVSLERMAFFVMAVATLGSAVFGAVPGAFWGHGHETFLAENGVRHVHHSPLQLSIIGHLHIMLTLIGVATTLIIGKWFDWKGILHKIGIPLFIAGTIVLTLGVWAVVPFEPIAHTIIYVGAVLAMSAALMLVIFGWTKLIKDGTAHIEKPSFCQGVAALVRDPLRFGSLWQMVFMNFTVSGVGIFMAIKLEDIFRTIPFREERIALTGHWHILSVLTGTIILFYIMSELFPLKGKARKLFGWGVIIGSDVAFAMMTIFALKRLWVTEEGQQPIVDFCMLLSEIGLGVLEVLLGLYMFYLLIRLINKKILTSCLLAGLSVFFVSCGSPAPEVHPESIEMNLTVEPGSWVPVPAGAFLSTLNEHEEEVDYDYEIMTTEVTYAQYAAYLNKSLAAGRIEVSDKRVAGHYPGDEFHDGRHEFPIEEGAYSYCDLSGERIRIVFSNGVFVVAAGYENFPAAYVTWFGADAFARAHGWRLPTEHEWEKAARGADGRAYPFGDEITPEMANYYRSEDPFDRPNGATPVGFYNGRKHGDFRTVDSPSPYGCYDMAGNVAEWIGQLHEGSHLRTMSGGCMADYDYDLRAYTENSSVPEYASFRVGFRCVRDPGGQR